MEKEVYSLCFMCSVRCPIQVKVKDGQVTWIEGNPHVAGMEGSLCPRGAAGPSLLYDDQRLQSPLIRVGKRGEGKWKRITWEEALDEIGEKMRESKKKRNDGIMYHVGRPGEDGYTNRCIQAWGVDGHNSHTNICSSNARIGYQSWMGHDRPSSDYANAEVIFLISSHLETGHYFNPHAQRIMEGKAKGAKVICVDTRLSNTGAKADYWLSTWPGTEPFMLLAIAPVQGWPLRPRTTYALVLTTGLAAPSEAWREADGAWAADRDLLLAAAPVVGLDAEQIAFGTTFTTLDPVQDLEEIARFMGQRMLESMRRPTA